MKSRTICCRWVKPCIVQTTLPEHVFYRQQSGEGRDRGQGEPGLPSSSPSKRPPRHSPESASSTDVHGPELPLPLHLARKCMSMSTWQVSHSTDLPVLPSRRSSLATKLSSIHLLSAFLSRRSSS